LSILIITGHGEYAKGMKSSLDLILGPKESIYAIDFVDSVDNLIDSYLKIIESNEGNILFACDLLGGTPFKEAAKLSASNKNIRVVTGANIGGLLDTSFKLETFQLDDLVENLITKSKENIVEFKQVEKKNVSSDGI